MKETRLITFGNKPDSIPEKKVYLTLIADEIRSYGIARYPDEHITKPANLAIEYLKYDNSYWTTFETCLRNFQNKSLEELKRYQNVFTPEHEQNTEKAIDDAIKYINEKIYKKDTSLSFKVDENLHADNKVITLLKKRSLQNNNEEKSDESGEEDLNQEKNKHKIAKIRDLPRSTVDKLEVRINDIAQNYLMIGALEHAIQRAEENEKGDKFRFKKFKLNSEEIYKDLMYDSDDEPKLSKLDRNSNANLINEAADNYEVVGKPKYRMNRRKFKKTLGNYFRPRLKKLREKYDKPE